MRRQLASALGGLALGWLAGPGWAADPSPAMPTIIAGVDASKPAVVQKDAAPLIAPSDCHESCGSSSGGHIMGGAGVMFLKAFPGQDPAAFRTVDSFTTPTGDPAMRAPTTATDQIDFKHTYEGSPLIWLGYVSDSGLGARVRWWHFEQKAEVTIANPDLPDVSDFGGITSITVTDATNSLDNSADEGDTFSGATTFASEKITLQVWDFEVTQAFNWNNWGLLAGAGVRYAQVHQQYRAQMLFSDEGTPLFTGGPLIATDRSAVVNDHNFDGVGPTISLEVRRPLGDSGLALYGNFRGSVLFGQEKVNTVSNETFLSLPFAFTNETFSHSATSDKVLPVGEVELGGEFSKEMGSVRPMIRAGIISQTWFGAGSPTSEAGSADGPTRHVSSNLGLFGFTVSAGLTY